MKRIEYGTDTERISLNSEYIQIFKKDIKKMEREWGQIYPKLAKFCGNDNPFPKEISDLLTCKFEDLVDIYLKYQELKKDGKINKNIEKSILELFRYSNDYKNNKTKQSDISHFFINHADQLHLCTCFYCELSYINAYGFKTMCSDIYEFIKKAPIEMLAEAIPTVNGHNISLKTAKLIDVKRKSFKSIKDFDNMKIWKNKKTGLFTTPKSKMIQINSHSHFDIDHFLPKSKSPITALSLYNFVPCCPICNERLKHAEIIFTDRDSILRSSPTSKEYKFEENVSFKIIPNNFWKSLPPNLENDNACIQLSTDDKVYQKEIIMFLLDERYNYHIAKAIRLYNKLYKYSSSLIKMMSNALNGQYGEKEIYEDIISETSISNTDNCFSKMYKDIIQIYKNQ